MSDPIVVTKQGQLLGKTLENRSGGLFYSFQGVPYAKTPVGNLRFKAPQPPESWTGIRDATKEGSECYSFDMLTNSIIGSEDCLFLNIFTPTINDKTKRYPVMVFIHGGGFVTGSSKTDFYGPEHLMTEDIVLVTINYRLGVFGFLSLEDQSLGVPGNAGLKDQVMALKWIQDNIEYFCGESHNVTIFGESAGGASVHLLCLSPMTKGLFHRAIIQSGCAINPWVPSTSNSKIIAEKLEIAYANESELLEKLQHIKPKDLVEVLEKIEDKIVIASKVRPLGVVVEKQTNEPAFLSHDPWDIMISGNYNKVPLMIGYTNREGMIYDFPHPLVSSNSRFETDYENLVPFALGLSRGSEASKKVAAKIKEFYANNEELNENNIDKDYVMRTDIFFYRGIYSCLRNHLQTSNFPIFFYRVSVESSLNLYKQLAGCKTPGVCHADELNYLFKTNLTPTVNSGSLEDLSISRFVKLWTTFAKVGHPTFNTDDQIINVNWKPVTKEEFHFLDIGAELTVGVNPDDTRMKFWDNIIASDPSICKKF